VVEGFAFPEALPEDIADLARYPGVIFRSDTPGPGLVKLLSFLEEPEDE
jgi:hypothetical protein